MNIRASSGVPHATLRQTLGVTESEPEADKKKPEHSSKFGVFLQKYATLLSSTVLGIAGLAATSICSGGAGHPKRRARPALRTGSAA